MKILVSNYQRKIIERLNEISNNWNHFIPLNNSMNYTLLNYGKFVRSIIVMIGLSDLGIETEKYIDVVCAIEMLQAYTLIHDDLPEMDNANSRRGKKANHLVYGPGIALLAGDALLTDTFLILSLTNINESKKIKLINLFAKKAGSSGVCFGQTLDIMNEKHSFDNWNDIEQMIKFKTCSLFELSFQTIGILATLNNEKLKLLEQIGYFYGLAFQIRDDLNDDIDINKIDRITKKNYHQMFGKDNALEKIKQLLQQVEKLCIKVFGENSNIFTYLKSILK